eukprot:scaffold29429_cov30-Tisochrysis_lutea.AAC.3
MPELELAVYVQRRAPGTTQQGHRTPRQHARIPWKCAGCCASASASALHFAVCWRPRAVVAFSDAALVMICPFCFHRLCSSPHLHGGNTTAATSQSCTAGPLAVASCHNHTNIIPSPLTLRWDVDTSSIYWLAARCHTSMFGYRMAHGTMELQLDVPCTLYVYA